ncbi:MAG: tetratricopeptide repeat protein [Planctomycetes bacterium]|nr:tetratricopeptide repeat protein [Planctomycetota bacterium]
MSTQNAAILGGSKEAEEVAYRPEARVASQADRVDSGYEAWKQAGRVSSATVAIMCGIGIFIFGWLLGVALEKAGHKGGFVIVFVGLIVGNIVLAGTPAALLIPAVYIGCWIYLQVTVAGYHKRFRKEAKDALLQADEGIAADPHNASAIFRKADALRDLSRTSQAIQTYQKALELAPVDSEHRNNLGLCLMQEKDHDRALDAFQEAVARVPENSQERITYRKHVAHALKKLGRKQEARDLAKETKRMAKLIRAA